VSDGQAGKEHDGQNPSGYYSALHCEQCGRAVKIECKKLPHLTHVTETMN